MSRDKEQKHWRDSEHQLTQLNAVTRKWNVLNKKYNQFYKVTPIGNAHLICVGNLEVEKTRALISFWKNYEQPIEKIKLSWKCYWCKASDKKKPFKKCDGPKLSPKLGYLMRNKAKRLWHRLRSRSFAIQSWYCDFYRF